MKQLFIPAALIAASSLAVAQSTIHGVDLRNGRFFTTDTGAFVANYQIVNTGAGGLFALDLDANANTMWAIQNQATVGLPMDFGTVDYVGGFFTVTGQITGPASATGLAAHPNGVDWYVSEWTGTTTNLWRGDITTGVFTLVGSDTTGGIIIDIAIDVQGNIYGHSISTDSFYRIDSNTGAQTLLGPTGLAANFAQGMDFDWSTNTLYATIYTGGGTGQFCSIDLTTGAPTLLEDTVSLNAEMEIAIFQPAPGGSIGTNYCTAVANSTGNIGLMSATGSTLVAANDVTLVASSLPTSSFGFFITSMTQGFVQAPGSAIGNLCVTGQIGRYVGPGQIQNSGATGSFSLAINLNSIPQPLGAVPAQPGQTWNFQTWHRDVQGGTPVSNFTNALEIMFQ